MLIKALEKIVRVGLELLIRRGGWTKIGGGGIWFRSLGSKI